MTKNYHFEEVRPRSLPSICGAILWHCMGGQGAQWMIAALLLLWDEDYFEMVIWVFDFSYTFTCASFMLESDISCIPHTYAFLPFGLDSFSSFSCALPFGLGLYTSYGLFSVSFFLSWSLKSICILMATIDFGLSFAALSQRCFQELPRLSKNSLSHSPWRDVVHEFGYANQYSFFNISSARL